MTHDQRVLYSKKIAEFLFYGPIHMWNFMRNCSGCFEAATADCTISMISPQKVTFLYLDVCVKEIDLCRTNSCYADESLRKMTIGFGSIWNFIRFYTFWV